MHLMKVLQSNEKNKILIYTIALVLRANFFINGLISREYKLYIYLSIIRQNQPPKLFFLHDILFTFVKLYIKSHGKEYESIYTKIIAFIA